MSEWIPVTERLPDKDGEYLVTKKFRYFGNTGIDIACWFKNLVEGVNNGFYTDHKVIAWMPLPKIYEEVPIENTEKVINKETEGTDL